MRRFKATAYAIAAGLALGLIVGAQPAWADHQSVTDNRDVIQYYDPVVAEPTVQAHWRNASTNINGCQFFADRVGETGGLFFLITPRVEDLNGNNLWDGDGRVIGDGDVELWNIQSPGASWNQSLKPRIRVNVKEFVAGTWVFRRVYDLNLWHRITVTSVTYSNQGSHNWAPGCSN